MNIKYSDFLEVCKAFYKLPKHDFLVFDYLSNTDIFHGSYTELAKNIGIDVSNARKAIYQLFDLGVVYIGKKEFFVLDNWYNNLLKTRTSCQVSRRKRIKERRVNNDFRSIPRRKRERARNNF